MATTPGLNSDLMNVITGPPHSPAEAWTSKGAWRDDMLVLLMRQQASMLEVLTRLETQMQAVVEYCNFDPGLPADGDEDDEGDDVEDVHG